MALDPIASRYAQALFESAKAQEQVEEVQRALALIGQLMAQQPEASQFLINPDVEPEQKVAVLDRALKGSMPPLVSAFLRMTLSFGRGEVLPGIIEAFAAAVELDQGRMRVTVRAARELASALLSRIVKDVERREGKTVELSTEVDQALVGGVQIVLDHRVIDGSVQRHLSDLRQQLKAVRVY